MLVNAQGASEDKEKDREFEVLSCVSAGTLWQMCATERP